ncbi:MAG: phosphoribosylamine--glycine ligase [Gemmatimonadetes bacterium]|nr:phosphoribosylamine--glycine ligase [Gemmatimonadota bacterium]
MNILIVGHGGREHALLTRLRQDVPDASFWITRGNGGTADLATHLPIDVTDVQGLAGWAAANAMELTVVGPETPLAAGIADAFAQRRLAVFGPTAAAAAIESSKAFAKSLMRAAGVPTAAFATFTALDPASAWIRERGAPIVVKASGLAAGKGAVVCETVTDAIAVAGSMLVADAFGEAGSEIVVEEFMQGEELSVFALCDGTDALLMLPSQDHKRIGEGDTGPNTGGMGAYAPVSIATTTLIERIRVDIIEPVLSAMREAGRPFRGLLYAGLMITTNGPRVVEFNARFGDPETQAVLPLLASSLFEPLLEIAHGGSVAGHSLSWRSGAALTTVLASAGYPESSTKGVPIAIPSHLLRADGLFIFHAGTRMSGDTLVTDGGRVLAVTATAPTLDAAARRSREAAAMIRFDGARFRRDIGWREIRRAGTA